MVSHMKLADKVQTLDSSNISSITVPNVYLFILHYRHFLFHLKL